MCFMLKFYDFDELKDKMLQHISKNENNTTKNNAELKRCSDLVLCDIR